MTREYAKVAAFPDAAALRRYLAELGVELPCDDQVLTAPESPLAQPLSLEGFRIGNRFCIQPMEGWDGTEDGRPSDFTLRRWQRFGESGAKLIWGGEAVAVRHEGRANPNQLVLTETTAPEIGRLREALVAAHQARYSDTSDLLIGLQLTHSGRFCRPDRKDRLEPRIVYHHPILDRKFGIPADYPLLTDSEIRAIIADYVRAARLAQKLGFQFLDIKHCHGYLGHEFLSAFTREGPYGGPFENRTRFLREIVAGVHAAAPGIMLGVRLSAFDLVPFCPDPARSTERQLGPGIPEEHAAYLPYCYAFGADALRPTELDLTETCRFMELLRALGITLVNLSAGSPYYNPHIQRPAIFPPSDGYQPPEDPLVGVARQVSATRAIKTRFPEFTVVGTAYSYLQEFLPHVAQPLVREGAVDFVGLGRMVLAYPELPADVLTSGRLRDKMICRTFSDCTTAPRNGLVSGCYPLDPFYKQSPMRQELLRVKAAGRSKT